MSTSLSQNKLSPEPLWFTKSVDAVDFLCRIYMRLNGLVRPMRIGTTFFGSKMNCDIRDFIQRRVYYFGIFEPNLSHYMTERIQPGDMVADVGANVGYISLLASHLAGPEGQVISVEAAPQTHAQLTANLALNTAVNVRAINMAATAAACMVEIVAGEERNIGSNTVKVAGALSSNSVPGRPLSIILGEALGKVAFIKIDVEGSEAPVLQDILNNLPAMPALKTVVSEMGPASAAFIEKFISSGFYAYALPNNYRIGATLVRKYLDRSGEGCFVIKIPVDRYDENVTDYVFERRPE